MPGTHDLDALTLGEDGSFSVILSRERPDGYDGDWWELGPETHRLTLRRCSCDWRNEVDARIAIDRLDTPVADMAAEEFARRFSELPRWIEQMIAFDMALIRYYREHHGVNTIKRSTKVDEMGGLPKQAYYDGMHEIADDEALDPRDRTAQGMPLLAGPGGRRPLLHRRLGEPPVEPQRLPGPPRQ